MSPELFSHAMGEIDERYIAEALTYRAGRPHRRGRTLLRAALAACLALTAALATALVVSASLRESVFGWLREQYALFTHYEYRQEQDAGHFVPYYLTELPPGYALVQDVCDRELGSQLVLCRNEESGKQFLFSVSSGGSTYVEAGGYTIRTAQVAGAEAELYIPEDPAKDGCIVWARGTQFFYLSGSFTPEELVYYAGCVQPVPEP